jgi:hypothetical protein
MRYSQKISTNQYLSGSQVLSIGIITEKFRSKVIQRKRTFLLWALNECDYVAEIYEKSHLSRSQVLSVEIIGEKIN